MTAQFMGLLALFLALLLAVAPFLGRYLGRAVEDGQYAWTAWGRPVERLIYRAGGIRVDAEMSWKQYAIAVLAFNVLGAVAVYALQRLQGALPLNPQGFGAVSPDSAFNTAISFVTNTNWQGYAGESTMSYLTQMLGLTVQNFVSAATGIAVVFALIRGFVRQRVATIGNFWVDLTRTTLYVLLPIATGIAVALVSQGVIQNFDAYKEVSMIAGDRQILAMGPVASQEAIKMLGTNGGGFFNANSAHPFENPTALANLIQMLAILLIPAALCFTFGDMAGDRRQGIAVLASMTVIFVAMACVAALAEQQANPALAGLPVDSVGSALQAGGNMEGKETRFGPSASSLFATITTAASCGAVNAMHDSFTAIGGMVPMLLIQLGEVVFGGVGSGLYGMLVYAVLAVFIAGLMIGRTPEYLGKKIEAYEMKMVALAILVTPLLVLLGTSVAVMTEAGRAGVLNPGTHGFSEILYALSSAANNNGSAFAGLSANTPFYNTLLALAMWLGRFWIVIPVLAMAGTLAAKPRMAASGGTMPTHGPLFVVLLVGTVLLVGALTYVPALALGPVAEQLQGSVQQTRN